jgi:hypothetical protein
LRSTRQFRAAAWPLLIGSALAVALAVVNLEARRPLRLAHQPRRVDQQITSRPTTNSRDSLSDDSAQRFDNAEPDTPHAIPTDVTAAPDELIDSPRTASRPTVFKNASRETNRPQPPVVSLGPVEKADEVEFDPSTTPTASKPDRSAPEAELPPDLYGR